MDIPIEKETSFPHAHVWAFFQQRSTPYGENTAGNCQNTSITQCSFVSGAMAHQEAIEFPRLAIVMVLMVLSLLLL
jgi:hypothetical protein